MTTRGATRRTRATFDVDPRRFAWSRWAVATLSHASLPWQEPLQGQPFREAAETLGERDRLSLLAQYAAHQAFLTFAGLADCAFDRDEWIVVTSRGSDARLVRIAAQAPDPCEAQPVVVLARSAADELSVTLEVLAQPWVRADHIYAEAIARLCRDAQADLRWARRSAYGSVDSPGADALRNIAETPATYGYTDSRCTTSLRRLAAFDESFRLETIAGVSPLQRLSALASIIDDATLAEAAAAERLIARRSGHLVHLVTSADAIDAASWRAIEIASGAGHAVWVTPRGGVPLPATCWFVVAPTLRVRAAVEARLGTVDDPPAWLEELVFSCAFNEYLASGELPPGRVGAIDEMVEPKRSFVGALALIGRSVPRELALSFLEHFLFSGTLEELTVPGAIEISDTALAFTSEDARRHALSVVPRASRAALCRVAATLTHGVTSALLWHEAGEAGTASGILAETQWDSSLAAVEALSRVPQSLLVPEVAATYAEALIDCGRYRDARDVAALARPDDRDLLLAVADRRSGDYAQALERLGRIRRREFRATVLRAELLRLTGHCDDAAVELSLARPATDEERVRHGYELSVLALDCGFDAPSDWMCDHYLAHRFDTYRALSREEYAEAEQLAARAQLTARTTTEKIDASLDRLYAAFVAGQWERARVIGIEALQEVEETQGDRAAGGILFTLAYLAADNGQWDYAANRIEVLRRYYADVHDDRRSAELCLLTAHLEFCRGRFNAAEGAALDLYEARGTHDQIREAAALILDEIDWMQHRRTAIRVRGGAGNAELARRARRLATLRAGHNVERVPPLRVCDELELFREAIERNDSTTAQGIAGELHLTFDAHLATAPTEIELLHAAATRDFPFAPRDFAQPWCFATRNRLGQWTTIGSAPAESAMLDAVLGSPTPDWIRCGERELLYVGGSSRWNRATRDAIAALFRIRAENHRLTRILKQDDDASSRRASAAPDGLVGESMVMRAIYDRVARVAASDIQVCILGESGTGKELVARSIHRQSARRHKPFVTLNCAALPENLIESELFGNVRGAFTGADRDRAGLIDSADGGTLFLDEIGELPLAAQAKLLRFLQDGEYRRVGDTAIRSADVRIVSATNRPLEARVEQGQFRDDLYYRIRGVEMQLPPLRDRGNDVTLLAGHFLATERHRRRDGPSGFSDDAEAAIAAYPWPGNVRELQNTIRGAVALAGEARQIDLEHLPERLRSALHHEVPAGSYQDAVTRFKRDLIERSLEQSAGNQNRAAALLRISRQALAYQIRELGILVGRNQPRTV